MTVLLKQYIKGWVCHSLPMMHYFFFILFFIVFFYGCASKPAPDMADQQGESVGLPQPDKQAKKQVIPKAVRDSYKMAVNELKSGRIKEATQRFEALIKTHPDLAGPYANLGRIFLKKAQYEQAEESFTEAIKRQPNKPELFNYLGIVYRQQGRFHDAKAMYENALFVDKNYAKAQLNLGILYDLYLNDYTQALEYYEKYLQSKPNDGDKVQLWVSDLKRRVK